MKSYRQAKAEFLRDYVQAALAAANGKRCLAARLAGLNRTYFFELMKQTGAAKVSQNRGNAAWQSLAHRDLSYAATASADR